jgi:hypothetical protein
VVSWSYSIDASAAENLSSTSSYAETFVLTLSDGKGGTANREFRVIIKGTNDVPVLSGELTGDRSLTEDLDFAASGTLNIADPDAGESAFTAVSTCAINHSSF